MEVTTTKCDVCGKLETVEDFDEPKGWYRLYRNCTQTGIDLKEKKDFWARIRDICDECALKLNLHLVCENADEMRAKPRENNER